MIGILLCISPSLGTSSDYIIPLIFILAVIPYMAFNLGLLGKHNRIFLGDAGSMFLGLAAVWLLMHHTQAPANMFSPVTALWLIALPLMDMLSIVVRRAANGKAPFHPDRNHLHHLFMDHGLSDRAALFVIGTLAVIFAAVGVISEAKGFSDGIMLFIFLGIFAAYYFLMNFLEQQVNEEPYSV